LPHLQLLERREVETVHGFPPKTGTVVREEHGIVDRRDHRLDLRREQPAFRRKMRVAGLKHVLEHRLDEREVPEPLADQQIDLLLELQLAGRSPEHFDAFGEPVRLDQVRGGLRDLRLVDRVNTLCARFRRQHRQNAGARPEIEHDVRLLHRFCDRAGERLGPPAIGDHPTVKLEIAISLEVVLHRGLATMP
jgi:hypothetical protein